MLSIQNVCVLSLTSVSVYPSLLHYFCVCVVSGNTHTARVCVHFPASLSLLGIIVGTRVIFFKASNIDSVIAQADEWSLFG